MYSKFLIAGIIITGLGCLFPIAITVYSSVTGHNEILHYFQNERGMGTGNLILSVGTVFMLIGAIQSTLSFFNKSQNRTPEADKDQLNYLQKALTNPKLSESDKELIQKKIQFLNSGKYPSKD